MVKRMVAQPIPDLPSPWHAGELALQRRLGVAERMDGVGRHVMRGYLTEQHRQFYPSLPFVVLGAIDAVGDVWATLRGGKPGFLLSPDPSRLHLDIPRDPADPADSGMDDVDPIALLGIDLTTRRRNRLNGTVRRVDEDGFDIVVGQSFGNCPQYITLRDRADGAAPTGIPTRRDVLDHLDARASQMITQADTFFVASYADREDGTRQADVSHRGGKAGFVRLDQDGVLTIPDFAGNRFFNTLGNFLVNPRAGLVFADFETGDLLQMTGDVDVILDSQGMAAFQDAERLWRFSPRIIIRRPGALPWRWTSSRRV